MPVESIRERIADAYRSALGSASEPRVGSAIVGTSVLTETHYGVRNTYRAMLPSPLGLSFPYRVVLDGPEKVTGKERTLNLCEMRLAIIATHRVPFGEEPNPATVANRIAADVQVVMESTALRTALLAVPGWTTHKEDAVTPLLAWPSDPLVSCELVYTVSYRRSRQDPAEVVP